uniref:ribosomal protein L6 n=1 Tax=Phytophthora cinnamomi TaxID=4785 RepID=UPI0020286E45|nr:ribosomal protein L6 [Phytophthora cinnamomi]DAZ88737.1 TPA_asm: ribosomal protein L6 [Phytophthora cinnamomi var. cinnamomi]UXG55791.1 ribosomal protein L6 [Phytophthora cinnamomi]WRY73326.1 ribosomal protein L6 [Phytophthora cinnamomi]WRY73365.1 ribosomal protein L6 [Phytophthora cinnamomi]WRY73406.1 ribosomal protein L6 [Phytophthora cinnamomi]
MIKILKKNIKLKNKNFFKSSLGNIQLFFIDKTFIFQKDIKIYNKNKTVFFKTSLGLLSLDFINNIYFFIKNNKLLITININKNKKSILNLYTKLIQIKIKGVLQGFKINLFLKGIGFKAFIENNNLILKLGFSHNIIIQIPSNIEIINQTNTLIFSSIDYIFLNQFVHYIKNHKKPEPYKGKGLLLKNEKILQKEGKKSKK